MVTISGSRTAAAGGSYFSEDEGYYVSAPGSSQWYDVGKLGLVGEVNQTEFKAVLRGYNPKTGEKLVANAGAKDIKDKETGKIIKKGHVGYIDVQIAAPKSASLLALINPKIEKAHNRAVEKVIEWLNAEYAFTRRMESGIMQTVKSDNLVIARINHYESRDLDPQLHSHLVLMNLTQGEDEKWRTMEAGKIFQDKLYLGQKYRNELAKELKKIGYDIEVTDPVKGFFEIKEVEPTIIKTYSKRRQAIEKKLEEYKEKDSYAHQPDGKKAQNACLATRKKKRKKKPEQMLNDLQEELAEIGQSLESINETALRCGQKAAALPPPRTAEQCVRVAIDDVMDKQAAATEKSVIDLALKGGMGYYTAEELSAVLRDQTDWELLGPGAGDDYPTNYYTTTETRRAEQAVVDYARRDRGRYGRAITADKMDEHMAQIAAEGTQLSTGQYKTVKMVCTSRDRMSVVQGDAGTGKTFAMTTAKTILAAEGITVRGFAPTGKAAEELNAVGVKSMTIHSYLESPNAQAEAGTGEVWLVDEAGMIGSRRLDEFLKKADEKQARVILIGDVNQFQSVEQGHIFQSLQDMRVVQKTEIKEVKRQKTKYTQNIVKAIKDDDFDTAFRELDQQNALKEIAERDDRIEYIVNEYIEDAENKTKSVVLTANNTDRDEINGKIRAKLAATGEVQAGEAFEMYQKNDLNSIAKTFGRAYKDGQIIITRRDNCGGIPRGTKATVVNRDTDNDIIYVKYYDKKAKEMKYDVPVDLRKDSAKFDVYNRSNKHFGVGDSVIFTKNDKNVGVSNGQTGTVKEIDGDGNAKIEVGNKIVECNLHNRGAKGYTYIDYAYCLTNHKSQGSTYDKVIVNADVSNQKTNYNAFYVQATRAKYNIVLVTDDKEKLAKQASVRESKLSTLDAVFEDFARQQQVRAVEIQAEAVEFDKTAEKARKDKHINRIVKDLAATTIPSSRAEWQTSERIEKKLQEIRYSSPDELQKRYTEQHYWTAFDPSQQDQNGNYVVASLNDKQDQDNVKYITAQPQDNGKILYWASVGKLKEPVKTEISVPFKSLNTAKAAIEDTACNVFLFEILNKQKELNEQKESARQKSEKTKSVADDRSPFG
jgi:conjugative relaxase-like TrwC/TraI family protein